MTGVSWYKKCLVVGVIILFIGVSVSSSTRKIDRTTCQTTVFNGSLSGYVKNTSGNPIQNALIRVHFHETYEEDYSDENGYYHVTNIPICYCMKNCTCSKEGYKIEWVLMGITENTTHDFVLYPLDLYPVLNGTMCNGWWNSIIVVSFVYDPEEVAEIWYEYMGWHQYTEPFIVDEFSSIDIDFYWIDYEGQQSPHATIMLEIDRIPPETDVTWEVYMEGFKWYVKFILTATDTESGMAKLLEIYFNDVLQEIIVVSSWPYGDFGILWSKYLKNVKFGFGYYDNACNFAYESVNGSEIKSCTRRQNTNSQQSFNIWLIRIVDMFPLLNLLLQRLRI